MLKLINRGKLDKPTQDEFEHLINRLGTFLGQIFDADGNFIDRSMVNARSVYYNDIAINNGSSTGTSTLPFAVDWTRAILHNLGSTVVVSVFPLNSTQVQATRAGTSGDVNVKFAVDYPEE